MGETLDHALDDLFGAVRVRGDFVADLHDGAPVLGGEVLVGSLGWDIVSSLFKSRTAACAVHLLNGSGAA